MGKLIARSLSIFSETQGIPAQPDLVYKFARVYAWMDVALQI